MNKFIVIVFLLFIFINKIQAADKISGDTNTNLLKFADFSKNEIIFSKDNYLIIGNTENDFNSIKYFADKHCSSSLGNNYISSSIQISINVAYVYCLMIDELYSYNLTEFERDCFLSLDRFFSNLYDRECKDVKRDFEKMLSEVRNYREKNDMLSSIGFIYEILDKDLEKKISNYEIKTLKNSDEISLEKNLVEELDYLQNPIKIRIDNVIIQNNIRICRLYGFVEKSELYYECLLALIKKININGEKPYINGEKP